MNSKKWKETLILSSVPLREINEQSLPINAASGCIIECEKKKLLITVEHATGNQGHWIIELKYDAEKGTQAYSLGTMNFLLKLSSTGAKPIDFSYVIIPDDIIAYSQEFDSTGNLIRQKPISVIKPDFNILPRSGVNYGFSGFVKVKRQCLNGQNYLLAEQQVYSDLQYLKSENEMHYFSLKGKHPGHEEFEGCSGAPILDGDGNVVALVCGGNTYSNTIHGINLSRMKIPIYALVRNQ